MMSSIFFKTPLVLDSRRLVTILENFV